MEIFTNKAGISNSVVLDKVSGQGIKGCAGTCAYCERKFGLGSRFSNQIIFLYFLCPRLMINLN